MMKKLMSAVLASTVLFTASMVIINAEVGQTVSVKLDGKAVSFPDAQPQINEDGRTIVPVRFVAENMGCKVDWEGSNQLVTLTKGNKRIALKIGENWAIVNDIGLDVKKEFDTKAMLKTDNGETRTYVPLRFVSETLGATVTWDGKSNTVFIYTVNSAIHLPTAEKHYSDLDRLKEEDIQDDRVKSIYNLGYYRVQSSVGSNAYNIAFTDKPNNKEVLFEVNVNPYFVKIDILRVTDNSLDMLKKVLQIVYPDKAAEYYQYYLDRLNEGGSKFENKEELNFFIRIEIVPYKTIYSTISKD